MSSRAFADDMVQYMPLLGRYAATLTRNRADADDLVQECVTRALAKRHLFQAGTNLKAWLLTILRNLHISQARRQAYWNVVDKDFPPVPSGQDAAVLLREVSAAFDQLPREYRAAISLVAIYGLSCAEASERLRIPIGTVKSRIARGRAALRRAVA